MAKKRTPVGDPHSPAPEVVVESEHEHPTSLSPPPKKSKSKSKSKSKHKSKRESESDSESKSKSKSKTDVSVPDTESKKSRKKKRKSGDGEGAAAAVSADEAALAVDAPAVDTEVTKSRKKKRKSDKGDASATNAVSASPAFAAPAVDTESKKSRKKKLKFDNDDVTANIAVSDAVASPAVAAPAVDTEPKKSKKKRKSDAGDATFTTVVSAAVEAPAEVATFCGATAATTQVVSDPAFADTNVVAAPAHNDDVTGTTAVSVAAAAPALAAPAVGTDSKKSRKKHKSDNGDITSATAVSAADEAPAVYAPSIAAPSDGAIAAKAPFISADDTIVAASPDHAGAANGGTERKLFQRIWSENDEIAILEGMIAYAEKHNKYAMSNVENFLSSIKKSIEFEGCSKAQLGDKVGRLKKRYRNNAAKPKYNPSKAHDQKVFLLSKKIWGKDVDSVTAAVKRKRDSSKRGGVAVDVGILKTVLPGLPVAVIERGLELLSEETKADLTARWYEIFASESDLVAKKKSLGGENGFSILKALNQG